MLHQPTMHFILPLLNDSEDINPRQAYLKLIQKYYLKGDDSAYLNEIDRPQVDLVINTINEREQFIDVYNWPAPDLDDKLGDAIRNLQCLVLSKLN